jgi:hypothetical protein
MEYGTGTRWWWPVTSAAASASASAAACRQILQAHQRRLFGRMFHHAILRLLQTIMFME